MRSGVLTSAFVFALAVTSCGNDSDPSDATGAPDAVASADITDTPAASDGTMPPTSVEPAGELADQYGVRYCEVLTITIGEAGTTAEVWGTQGLNDCPQDTFDAIDPVAVVAEMGVTAAIPNGPRYWVLDEIVANELAGSGEIRDFGGIEMRSIATVDLGPGLPDRSPYSDRSVARDTEFAFAAGRTIHELTASDGSIYVMQSYSTEVDPSLTADALAGLGGRLELPDGWTFASRVLDDQLVVEDIDGIATVIQDELLNSYQLRRRG